MVSFCDKHKHNQWCPNLICCIYQCNNVNMPLLKCIVLGLWAGTHIYLHLVDWPKLLLTKDLTISNKQAMHTYVYMYICTLDRGWKKNTGTWRWTMLGQPSYWNLIMNCSSKRDYSGLLDCPYCIHGVLGWSSEPD